MSMRIIFLLLLSSVFLVSCGRSPSEKLPEPTEDQTKDASFVQTLDKASSKIKNTPEFEACMKPSVNMCINQIGNQLARAKNSPEFCDEIEDVQWRGACKYGVVMTQASTTKDITLCDKLESSYKKECRISLLIADAMSSKDIEKCDLIDDEVLTQSGSAPSPRDRGEQCRADVIMRNEASKLTDCDVLKQWPTKDMCRAIIKNRSVWARAQR